MWTIGELQTKTVYIPRKVKGSDKETTFPVTFHRLPLIYTAHDGSREEWAITFKMGKHGMRFGLHYPDTYVDVDKKGYYRPNGKKRVQNRDTGLDASTLIVRLKEKFPKEFVMKIVKSVSV